MEKKKELKRDEMLDNDGILMCAYFDKKSENYDIPFFAKNEIQAKRKFYLDCTVGKNMIIGGFTSDFDLYKVGVFSLKTGMVNPLSIMIISGEKMKESLPKGGE